MNKRFRSRIEFLETIEKSLCLKGPKKEELRRFIRLSIPYRSEFYVEYLDDEFATKEEKDLVRSVRKEVEETALEGGEITDQAGYKATWYTRKVGRKNQVLIIDPYGITSLYIF